MKHRMTRLLAPAVALLLLAACQPTPTKPLVVGKNDGKLDEKLRQTATPAAAVSVSAGIATVAPPESLRSRFNIPDTWVFEKTDDDDKVRLRIDAVTEIPDVTRMAIYTAQTAAFTTEQIETIRRELLGGAQLYEPTGPTRQYWQQQIVLAEQELAESKDKEPEDYIRKIQSGLDYAKEQYQKTPDSVKQKELNLSFQRNTDGADGEFIHATATVAGQPMALYAYNGPVFSRVELGLADSSLVSPMWYSLNDMVDSPQGVSMAKEEALRTAKEIMRRIDSDLRPVSIMSGSNTSGNDNQLWLVTFTRFHDGVPSCDWAHSISEEFADNKTPGYEQVLLGINDKGAAYFRWTAPLQKTAAVNGDAALMSMAQFTDTASQALYRYGQGLLEKYGKNGTTSVGIIVKRVVLGLTRVVYKDHPGEYLLVPSWDFFGTISQDGSKETKNEKPASAATSRLLMTINAVDGSVIDTAKGY